MAYDEKEEILQLQNEEIIKIRKSVHNWNNIISQIFTFDNLNDFSITIKGIYRITRRSDLLGHRLE